MSTAAGAMWGVTPASADGIGDEAVFGAISNLQFDRSGNLVLIDRCLIRQVSPVGVVTTLLDLTRKVRPGPFVSLSGS